MFGEIFAVWCRLPTGSTLLCAKKGSLLGAVFLWESPGCVGPAGLLSPQFILLLRHLRPQPQGLLCPQELDDGRCNAAVAGPEPNRWALTPGALGPPALSLAAARHSWRCPIPCDTSVTGAPLRFPLISWEEDKFLLLELPRVLLCQ